VPESPADVVVRFELTEAEFITGGQRGMQRLPGFWILPPLTVCMALFVVVHFWSTNGRVASLVGLVALCCYWPWLYYWLPRRRYRVNAAVHDQRELAFGADGVTGQYGSRTVTRPWGQYREVLEFDDMYVLRYRGNSSTVPKRAFATPDQEERFRSLVAAHCTLRLAQHT